MYVRTKDPILKLVVLPLVIFTNICIEKKRKCGGFYSENVFAASKSNISST